MSFLTSRTLRSPIASLSRRAAFSTSPISRVSKITIVGRLAAQPEAFTTASGQEIVRYAVGTNSGSGDNRTTSWWKVASFQDAPGRERLVSLGKGSLVYVEGNCQMRKFEKDGNIESSLSIVQQKIEVLKRNESEAEGEGEATQ